jgi:hypothetical protein
MLEQLKSRKRIPIMGLSLVTLAVASIGTYAQASSFGLQSGFTTHTFPVGIQLELDTTDRSSLGLGLSLDADASLGFKYFYNTTNHSGLFTEISAGTTLDQPSASVYLQQGYRWVVNNQMELDLQGGIGVVGVRGQLQQLQPQIADGVSNQNNMPWNFWIIPGLSMRLGFRF